MRLLSDSRIGCSHLFSAFKPGTCEIILNSVTNALTHSSCSESFTQEEGYVLFARTQSLAFVDRLLRDNGAMLQKVFSEIFDAGLWALPANLASMRARLRPQVR